MAAGTYGSERRHSTVGTGTSCRAIVAGALLIVFGLADKYGVSTKVHTYGPVLASIVVHDVVDDTSVVTKEGIE